MQCIYFSGVAHLKTLLKYFEDIYCFTHPGLAQQTQEKEEQEKLEKRKKRLIQDFAVR